MLGQVVHRLMWLVGFCPVVLIIGIIGCGGDEDDDNDWVGTWSLETIDGQSFEELFEEEGVNASIIIITNNWTFNSDGTMEVEFAVKIEVKEEGLELSAQGGIKITGTYSLSGSNYTLTPIGVEGTGLYKEVAEADLEIVPTTGDTGTWSRRGNTLTLNSDDGAASVFKKK